MENETREERDNNYKHTLNKEERRLLTDNTKREIKRLDVVMAELHEQSKMLEWSRVVKDKHTLTGVLLKLRV